MWGWQEGGKIPRLWKPSIRMFLMELSMCLAETGHPTPRCLFKKNENLRWLRCLYGNVYKHLSFIIPKKGKQCQSPSRGEQATQCGRVTQWSRTQQRKGRHACLHSNVGEPHTLSALCRSGDGSYVTAHPCQNSQNRTCKQREFYYISLCFKNLSWEKSCCRLGPTSREIRSSGTLGSRPSPCPSTCRLLCSVLSSLLPRHPGASKFNF